MTCVLVIYSCAISQPWKKEKSFQNKKILTLSIMNCCMFYLYWKKCCKAILQNVRLCFCLVIQAKYEKNTLWNHKTKLIFINHSYDIIRNKLFPLPRYRGFPIYFAEGVFYVEYKILLHITVFSSSAGIRSVGFKCFLLPSQSMFSVPVHKPLFSA